MKCQICSKTIPEVSLFRQNAKGEIGIWRCREHNLLPIPFDIGDIVSIIEKSNKGESI